MRKVVVIGLDGCNPELIYGWLDELPNMKAIMDEGLHGPVESSVPPITPQAWTSALSGKNPGQFGFWDFRYRDRYLYGEPNLIDSTKIKVDTLYKILPRYGKKVAIINVPLSYPPPQIPGGYSISCFMTPSIEKEFTHPPGLRREVERLVGEYILDASTSDTNFRKMDKKLVLDRIYRMDEQRFELIKYFIREKELDFIFAVIMGTDRMPHLFYRYMDPEHVRHEPDSPFRDAIKDHYKFCDEKIGEIRALLDEETALIVLSDHSVQRLDGRINLNEWLIQEGYLCLRRRPEGLVPLTKADVDWGKTRAWATGYTGQIYVNLKGRERSGTVPPEEYESFLDEVGEKLKALPGEKGNRLETRIFKRREIHFGEFAELGPDLFIYFDNCRWNISELIGYDSIYSYDTPLGADDGGHGPEGILMMAGPGVPEAGARAGITLLDVAPTVLDLMGISVPPDMEGRELTEREAVYSEEDEEELKKRLAGLGYFSN